MSEPTLHQYQHEIGASLSRADWEAARTLAARCRAAWPDDPSGWLLGSMAALFADQKDAALDIIEERLSIDPDNTQCRIQQAECLFALGQRERAFAAADLAADGATHVPEALDAVGTFLTFANEHSRALRVYDLAVAVAPSDHRMVTNRAMIHQYLGNFDRAAHDFETALTLSPGYPDALKGLAELRRQSSECNSIAAMEAALAATPGDPRAAATLHFGLAKSYEDVGEYSKSWRHLTAANQLERARLQYNPEQDRATIKCIIGQFPDLEGAYEDSTGESPIFIVGLPRTGTTLVERIIGSHSAVHSAGELSALAEAVSIAVVRQGPAARNWLGFTQTFGKLDEKLIAQEYLARARAQRGDRPRFSDKAPANFFYCALILRAFPNARIIHLTRHPLAACYAIFKTRFTGGYPFSYDLAELADFYVSYRQLMAHWHRTLSGRVLDVAYEDVVTAQQATTRRLLDFIDLPFEAACLDFHLNPASTSTSSSVQVRQPLYDSSLRQWRYYAAELEPLRRRLEAAGIIVEDDPGSVSAAG